MLSSKTFKSIISKIYSIWRFINHYIRLNINTIYLSLHSTNHKTMQYAFIQQTTWPIYQPTFLIYLLTTWTKLKYLCVHYYWQKKVFYALGTHMISFQELTTVLSTYVLVFHVMLELSSRNNCLFPRTTTYALLNAENLW